MPDAGQLSDQEAAAQRRRRWLAERHARTRALVVLLLRQAPEAEAEVAAALDQLPGGELQRLAHLLAHTTGPQQRQHTRPVGLPSDQPGAGPATPPRR
jgi:hypothetical protein